MAALPRGGGCGRVRLPIRWVGQDEAVLSGKDLSVHAAESVTGDSGVRLGAEDQANRAVFFRQGQMFGGVVDVEVHLARVSVVKLADFEVNNHQAAQAAMDTAAGQFGTRCRPPAGVSGGQRT